MAMNQVKRQYILHHFDCYIDELVGNVLGNDPEDPHYSAVAATNCIKCYIELCEEWGENLSYSDVEGYLRHAGLTEEECRRFEESRAEESLIYIGEQF